MGTDEANVKNIWTPETMGRKGGQTRTAKKLHAALENLSKIRRKRGRKRLPADQIQPASLKRRLSRRAGNPP
jgi:hypothetical protein